MIVEMLQPSSLPWTRLLVATLAGFHNISTQPTFGKSLKLSQLTLNPNCPAARRDPPARDHSASVAKVIYRSRW